MEQNKAKLVFTKDEEFTLSHCRDAGSLYFPLMSEKGLKSAITPGLRGDLKTDQNHFLLEPASIQNLSESLASRNFWCDVKGGDGHRFVWSATGCSHEQSALTFSEDAEEVNVSGGFLWHRVERRSKRAPLQSRITSFIPYDQNVELHLVSITNTADTPLTLSFTAAIPIYGRSADNLRDHRHVTSLLHRISVKEAGVFVCPTMSFDERGHKPNSEVYYVSGIDEDGACPNRFYPTVDGFVGEGDFFAPQSVYEKSEGVSAGGAINGQEAMGGLGFAEKTLAAGASATYLIGIGMGEDALPGSIREAEKLLQDTCAYWKDKVKITFTTGNEKLNSYLRWIAFQPELRRVFGCSFLPHHDYGRGGRGWRDLWQDCLGLLLLDPASVRPLLVSNCDGIRTDGTNATIIGNRPGEFKADRNAIPRVWMDHGMWPLMTVKLYLDETGDLSLLSEEASYFKDRLCMRGDGRDETYHDESTVLVSENGEIYRGSVLEHLLIQNLTAVGDLGEHGYLRLRGADWNDALDMASENGESVAFSFAYEKNLRDLADILAQMEKETTEISVCEELLLLLPEEGKEAGDAYSVQEIMKRQAAYLSRTKNTVSGRKKAVSLKWLEECLSCHARALRDRLQQQWLKADGDGYFNSYFDNHKKPLEGFAGANGIRRMMLTGQVFAIMSGVADKEQVKRIIQSADALLYDEGCGGYRLNTDFGELKMDMGRMFGFAYGEKENGAVFSHMAVMYAYALYSRGEKEAGAKALFSLYRHAMDYDTARIYPGIPEYFDQWGRGLYHYLTGAASWYLYTMTTGVYGIRGEYGDLVLDAHLTEELLGEKGEASIDFVFAKRLLRVTYILDEGRAGELLIDGATAKLQEHAGGTPEAVRIPRKMIEALPPDTRCEITYYIS